LTWVLPAIEDGKVNAAPMDHRHAMGAVKVADRKVAVDAGPMPAPPTVAPKVVAADRKVVAPRVVAHGRMARRDRRIQSGSSIASTEMKMAR
jgi:hypothetical protein